MTDPSHDVNDVDDVADVHDRYAGALALLRRAAEHLRWADGHLVAGLAQGEAPAEAVRELAHVLAATETWVARLEGRVPRCAVWPDVAPDALPAFADEVHDALARWLAAATPVMLGGAIAYANTAGQRFETPVADVLVHLVLHAQYHRGKVNLLLRQAGRAVAPVDFILFSRGAPAVTPPAR